MSETAQIILAICIGGCFLFMGAALLISVIDTIRDWRS